MAIKVTNSAWGCLENAEEQKQLISPLKTMHC